MTTEINMPIEKRIRILWKIARMQAEKEKIDISQTASGQMAIEVERDYHLQKQNIVLTETRSRGSL